MPTAGKLIGAVIFAALAWLTAELFKPVMPEGTGFGRFSLICAAIGAACGWFVMGPRVGRGRAVAISAGLQTSLTTAFFALLGFSIYLMVGRALRKLYDGPLEAITGMFGLMVEHGLLMVHVPVLLALLVGGPLCGWFTWVLGRAR